MSVIELAIKDIGITIVALAKQMGVSRQTVYNWISKKSSPSAEQIIQLGKILRLKGSKILNDYK